MDNFNGKTAPPSLFSRFSEYAQKVAAKKLPIELSTTTTADTMSFWSICPPSRDPLIHAVPPTKGPQNGPQNHSYLPSFHAHALSNNQAPSSRFSNGVLKQRLRRKNQLIGTNNFQDMIAHRRPAKKKTHYEAFGARRGKTSTLSTSESARDFPHTSL